MSTPAFRLPKSVRPKSYQVVLTTSPKKSSFAGDVTMELVLGEPVESILLHARDLAFKNIRLTQGSKARKGKARLRKDDQAAELSFGAPLKKGKARLQIAFTGKLNPSMHGLYLAQDGAERAIVSQCEAADARAIFPCFDEPEFKATLQWTVRTDKGLEVVTNGVAAGRKTKGTQIEHRFKPTRVISSYLAAVTVGKLDATQVFRVAGTPCRILAGAGKLGQTGFARDVTRFVLPWYERYFGHKHNYQKLDQVAVPGFDAGAMENVGAIFYRQNLLLAQPGATSWKAEKRIAEVIAHEIAHQWFGNLVTMKWWDDLWLNEAFATWVAYKVCNAWKPEWRIWDDFLEGKESALAADALKSTHPIYTPVGTPAEATELFDVITYEKGCAVLRMVESFLGDAKFEAGIQSYIRTFKNTNAAGSDLWEHLGQAAAQPVGELMQSWIGQAGFPLLRVSLGEGGAGGKIHLSQRRFFAEPQAMQDPDDARWHIPIVIAYDAGNGVEHHRVLMSERELTVQLPTEAELHWVYPNDSASGFYRLQFNEAARQGLLERGLWELAPAARAALLSDQWALVKNGLSDIETFMDVLKAFRQERDHVPTATVTSILAFLNERLVDDASRPRLATFTRWLLGAQRQELGWDASPGEDPGRGLRRAQVIDALGSVGRDAEILREAEERARAEAQDPLSQDPNLAGTVVALAALRGDRQRFARYVEVYNARKAHKAAPELLLRYVGGFAAFEDPQVVPKALGLCLDGTIPQEQWRILLIGMLGRRATGATTWEFLQKHWEQIGTKVGSMSVARLVEATGTLPVDRRDEVAEFFAKHPVEEAKRALQKALEALELRKELIAREQGRLADWLRRGPADDDVEMTGS